MCLSEKKVDLLQNHRAVFPKHRQSYQDCIQEKIVNLATSFSGNKIHFYAVLHGVKADSGHVDRIPLFNTGVMAK